MVTKEEIAMAMAVVSLGFSTFALGITVGKRLAFVPAVPCPSTSHILLTHSNGETVEAELVANAETLRVLCDAEGTWRVLVGENER